MSKTISRRTRTLVICLSVPFALLAFFAGKRLTFANAFARFAESGPRPFMLYMREDVPSANDQHSLREFRFFEAVRGDGSRAYGNLVQGPDGSWKTVARRLALISERRTMLIHDSARLYTSFKMPDAMAASLLNSERAKSCGMSGYAPAGDDAILGYKVTKLETEDKEARTEQWQAANLACRPLKVMVYFKGPDGAARSITQQNAISVNEGEPPAEIFEVPKDYSEVAPSDLFLHGQLNGVLPNVTDTMRSTLQKMDNAYERSKH